MAEEKGIIERIENSFKSLEAANDRLNQRADNAIFGEKLARQVENILGETDPDKNPVRAALMSEVQKIGAALGIGGGETPATVAKPASPAPAKAAAGIEF